MACRGAFLHSGISQAQTLIHNQSNSHQHPFTAQLHTNTCAGFHTLLPHAWIYVWTLSHGFVRPNTLRDMEYNQWSAHLPMHTHICLSQGFGLGNSFARNKNQCQKAEQMTNQSMGSCRDKSKHIATHTLWRLSVSQGSPHNYSSQLQCLLPLLPLGNLTDSSLICLWLQGKLGVSTFPSD